MSTLPAKQRGSADFEPGSNVLALNSGSSSLKFGLYCVHSERIDRLLSGEIESIGGDESTFRAMDSNDRELACTNTVIASPNQAIAHIAKLLDDAGMPAPVAIGHRIVHGGPKLRQHCLINDQVLRQLEAASHFAPLHAPSILSVIRHAQEQFPDLPQVACFDTAFHAGLPEVSRVLPISRTLLESEAIQRYGFHGLSCESVVHQLGNNLPERLIIAHLGNGASVTAVKSGKSIDTSMGLTPNGGMIMGTRSGDLDPGILGYLMRKMKFDAAKIEALVDQHSGLLGISGVSSDMRCLHEAAASNSNVRLAIDMFCNSACKQIAAMITVLDGVDLIVFTGGIGENDYEVRERICAGLSWIGVRLDVIRNRPANCHTENSINDSTSRCLVKVLASQEDEQIARHVRFFLHNSTPL